MPYGSEVPRAAYATTATTTITTSTATANGTSSNCRSSANRTSHLGAQRIRQSGPTGTPSTAPSASKPHPTPLFTHHCYYPPYCFFCSFRRTATDTTNRNTTKNIGEQLQLLQQRQKRQKRQQIGSAFEVVTFHQHHDRRRRKTNETLRNTFVAQQTSRKTTSARLCPRPRVQLTSRTTSGRQTTL